jgi:hypothetical protein
MEEASWVNCQPEFAIDGSLVDLIAPGTGPAQWESFWSALRSGPYDLQAYRDGEPVPLPETAASAIAERAVASVTVQVMAGTVNINCHFFGGDLELDIDRREIVSEQNFNSVLALMRFVAASVDLPILATPEGGGVEYAFLRVSSDGRAVLIPPRSKPD